MQSQNDSFVRGKNCVGILPLTGGRTSRAAVASVDCTARHQPLKPYAAREPNQRSMKRVVARTARPR